jgi:hypothetical protein
MDLEIILEKWYEAKKKLEDYEEKINKYKLQVMKEMNKLGTDKVSTEDFTVSRRRNVKRYLSKDLVPKEVWNQYSTECSYDAFFLTKNRK